VKIVVLRNQAGDDPTRYPWLSEAGEQATAKEG
jgi:hypothetical protein